MIKIFFIYNIYRLRLFDHCNHFVVHFLPLWSSSCKDASQVLDQLWLLLHAWINQSTLFSNRSVQFPLPSHCFCYFKFINSLSNSYLLLFVIPIAVSPIRAYLPRLCAWYCFVPLWSLMLYLFFQCFFIHIFFFIYFAQMY